MRIAIIGSGIAGLTCAHILHPRHEVTLFEARSQPGGHVRTVEVSTDAGRWAVDTGFVVYNETTYPGFVRLLARLGVETQETDMSFSISCRRTGLEYCGSSLDGLFAQRRNLLRPAFWGMIRDILRFNRQAPRLLDKEARASTLGHLLREGGYGQTFRDRYLLPMASAIWSTDADRVLEFPARFIVRFFQNHGLLGVRGHLAWRTVVGGSRTYVDRLLEPLRRKVRTDSPVRQVRRGPDAVRVRCRDGVEETYDQVILATHSDQALEMLADPSPREREILGSFAWLRNEAVLHGDPRFLPRRKRAWASWNYTVPSHPDRPPRVTYDMGRLQRLDAPTPLLTTLNPPPGRAPVPEYARLTFHHPGFSSASEAAQGRHEEISGPRFRTHYCGAYWRYGFHEDGLWSARRVCRSLGEDLA